MPIYWKLSILFSKWVHWECLFKVFFVCACLQAFAAFQILLLQPRASSMQHYTTIRMRPFLRCKMWTRWPFRIDSTRNGSNLTSPTTRYEESSRPMEAIGFCTCTTIRSWSCHCWNMTTTPRSTPSPGTWQISPNIFERCAFIMDLTMDKARSGEFLFC